MGACKSTITIGYELRPCFAKGKRALFHQLGVKDLTGVAIVEYEDGRLDFVPIHDIIFCDTESKFAEELCAFDQYTVTKRGE